jgi:NRPS condensation-like uncharacterized protein
MQYFCYSLSDKYLYLNCKNNAYASFKSNRLLKEAQGSFKIQSVLKEQQTLAKKSNIIGIFKLKWL